MHLCTSAVGRSVQFACYSGHGRAAGRPIGCGRGDGERVGEVAGSAWGGRTARRQELADSCALALNSLANTSPLVRDNATRCQPNISNYYEVINDMTP